MKSGRIARFVVAGSVALAAPLLALAQPAPAPAPAQSASADGGQRPGPGSGHAHRPGMRGEAGHPGHGRMHPGMHGSIQRHGPGDGMGWLRGVNLTEQQRDKVFEIMHGSAPAIREQAKVVRQTGRELARLPLSADYDPAKARALAERNAQAAAQLAELRARNQNEIYRQLTPEQQKLVSERVARFEQRGDRPMRDGAHPGAPRQPRPAAPSRG